MDEDTVKNEPDNDLDVCKKTCDEYLNNWKRAAADLINYKKDEAERMAFLGKYAKESMIFNILPIIDSIELAKKSIPESLQQDPWTSGFTQIQNQIKDFLKKEGIEEIETVGKKFDPNFMEAVGEVEAAFAEASAGQRAESETVAEELQKGYKIEDRILRPAKVKISK